MAVKTRNKAHFLDTKIGRVVIIILCVVMFFLIVMAFRLFSQATVAHKLYSPRPGVECASLVTGDGVAVDCWRSDGLVDVGIEPGN